MARSLIPQFVGIETTGLLLGSGKLHSEEYWKQLEGLLLNQGLLEYNTSSFHRTSINNSELELRYFSAMRVTYAGGCNTKLVLGHVNVHTKVIYIPK